MNYDDIYIPDPIERMEAAAERQFDEQMTKDGFRCSCGRVFDPDKEGGTVSPNPWAMPVCGECLEKAFPGHDI